MSGKDRCEFGDGKVYDQRVGELGGYPVFFDPSVAQGSLTFDGRRFVAHSRHDFEQLAQFSDPMRMVRDWGLNQQFGR